MELIFHDFRKDGSRRSADVESIFVSSTNVEGKKKLSFFTFPKDPERSKRWVVNCRTANLDKKTTAELNAYCLVCAEHFEDRMFMNVKDRNKLVHNAVPTVFNFPQSSAAERREKSKPPTLQCVIIPIKVHFDESQFEQNRKDGKRKLKPNAVPTIYETIERSSRPVKRNRVSVSHLQDRNNETVEDDETTSGDEDHRDVKRMKKWKPEDALTAEIKMEALDESDNDEDNGDAMEATESNEYGKPDSNLNKSTRGGGGRGGGSPGMAASTRTDSLRSTTGSIRVQTPSTITLEKRMSDEEENLLKEWDTTVRCRQENSLSIRPISTDDASTRISGLKPKPHGSVDLAPSGLEFPEIDIVKRHDSSHDNVTETFDDDSRRFTVRECPTTGRRTMRLEMNVEGFEPRDITVKSFNGRLTVHGIAYDGKKSTNEFCRKIKLPDGVSSENVRCTFFDNVLVLEAPVRTQRSSTPDVASKHLVNRPVVLSDENGRYLSLVVELGRLFRPSDVTVKVRGQQTICIFAETVENTSFSRMKAKLEREFDLPERIEQRSLRAGCTEDLMLKIVARIKEPELEEERSVEKAVRVDIS